QREASKKRSVPVRRVTNIGRWNGAEGGLMSRRLVNPVLQFLRGFACVLALGGALCASYARTQPADRTGDPGPPAQGAAPERQGEPLPLPPGAVARLGWPVDFKSGRPRALTPGNMSWVGAIDFTPDGKSLISAA